MDDDHTERIAAALTLAVDRTTAEVCRAFDAAHIPYVLLKGPSFQWFWPTTRPYGDSDLLVPPDDHDRASALLAHLGFSRRRTLVDPGHAATLDRADLGQTVDLHWTIKGVVAPPDVLWDRLQRHVQHLDVGDGRLTVLDHIGTALHAALHAAQHGPSFAKPTQDVELLLARDDVPWGQVAKLADELGATMALRIGLERAGGHDVAETVGLPAVDPLAVHVSEAGSVTRRLHQLSTMPTKRWGTALLQHAFPHPATLRQHGPSFANRGTFGLLAAYVYWPVRLLFRAARYLPGYLRARAASRHGR